MGHDFAILGKKRMLVQLTIQSQLWIFYEQISTDSNRKQTSHFCANCAHRVWKNKPITSTTSATDLRRHVELKHPTSLEKYVRVNGDRKKSLTKGKTMSQQPRSLSTQVKLTAFCKGVLTFISQQVDRLARPHCRRSAAFAAQLKKTDEMTLN